MSNSKRTKGQTMIYKALHKKLVIQQHEPTKNRGWGWTQMLRKGKQFLLHIPVVLFLLQTDDKSGMKKEPDCDYDKWTYSWSLATHG